MDQTDLPRTPTTTKLNGSGAIAQNQSIAAGEHAIAVGGNVTNSNLITAEQVTIIVQEIQPDDQPHGWDGRMPYVGLTAFREHQATLFFGRKKLIQHLLGQLSTTRLLCIAGPSGSGKSSLVQAGLIPALRANQITGSDQWLIETLTPGNQPLENLALALGRLAKSPAAAAYFRAHGVTDPTAFHAQVDTLLTYDPGQCALIVVDQFEEIFTQTKNETARQQFLNILTHTVQQPQGRVRFLLVLRSDFVSQCATYPALRKQMSGHIELVGAMEPEELTQAITLPALATGVMVQPDLVAQMINDMAGEPGTLPLMEFALQDLFNAQHKVIGQTIVLTCQAYLDRGGIQQALERHADAIFAQLTSEQQQIAQLIFSRLIEIGRGTVDTRRTITDPELATANVNPQRTKEVVAILADARLVTTGATNEDTEHATPTLTLAHEKLIEAWPWLRRLINANRELIALHNQISEDANSWQQNAYDASYLYTGIRLATVQERLATTNLTLNAIAQNFINIAIRAAEQTQQHRRRQRQLLILTLAGATLLFATLAILAEIARRNSDFQRDRAQTQALLNQAINLGATNPEVATLVGLAALQKAQTLDAALATNVQSELIALVGGLQPVRVYTGYDAPAYRVQFSLDDAWVAVGTGEVTNTVANRSVAVWRVDGDRTRPQLFTHANLVNDFAFSPDNQTLLTASRDGTAKLWSLQDAARPHLILDHGVSVNSATFTHDGRAVITAANDGQLRLWSVIDGHLIKRWPIAEQPLLHLALSGDDQRLIAGDAQGVLYGLSLTATTPMFTSHCHTGAINNIAFTPDGSRIATAAEDKLIYLIQWDKPGHCQRIGEHPNVVLIRFNPEGTLITSASRTSEPLHVWKADGSGQLMALNGKGNWAACGEFAPDGQQLAACLGQTIHLQSVTNFGAGTILSGHAEVILATAFAHNGEYIGAIDAKGQLRIWAIGQHAKPPFMMLQTAKDIAQLTLSPDQQQAAVLAKDNSIWNWNISSTTELKQAQIGAQVQTIHYDSDKTLHLLLTNASTNQLEIWSQLNGQWQLTHALPTNLVADYWMDFDPIHHLLATSSSTGEPIIWSYANARKLFTLSNLPLLEDFHFQPTLERLTVYAFPEGWLLDTKTVERKLKLPSCSSDDTFIGLQSAHNGQIYIATTMHELCAWSVANDLSRSSLLWSLPLPGAIQAAGISQDGQWVSAANDNIIYVWHINQPTKQPSTPLSLRGHTGVVNSLIFTSDNQWLWSASSDGTVRKWPLTTDKLLDVACQYLTRPLTDAEKAHYIAANLPNIDNHVCRSFTQ